MIIIALLIGVILIVAAIRNSQDALFKALATDVPEFVVWAAAIFAVGAIGFIPGLKPISRGLLALIIIVIVLHNYKNILAGFTNAWQSPPPASSAVSDGATSAAGGVTGGIGSAGPSLLDSALSMSAQVAPSMVA